MNINYIKFQIIKNLKVIILFLIAISFVYYFQFVHIIKPAPEISGPAIVYDHLSNEKDEPFLKFGKPINEMKKTSRTKGGYLRAIRRFPDVRSCLARSEHAQKTPDLRKINWRKIRNKPQMEVCMYRILLSLGTPEKSKLWFEAQGIGKVEITQRSAYKKLNGRYVFNDGKNIQDTYISISAIHSTRNTGKVYVPSTGFGHIISSVVNLGENFRAIWSNEGTTLETTYGSSAIF